MSYEKLSKNYNRTNIETAGKIDLVILCYERTTQLLIQAKGHFKENEIEKKARKMQKALDIINELQSCLCMKEGGQIARNLDAIYTYLNKRLLLGDIQQDISAFDECVRILTELKGAWDEIAGRGADPIGAYDKSRLSADHAQIAA